MSAQQKKHQFIHGQPSMGLPFQKELVVDLFAGGGGASTGIARAYREPDVAVNHNPIALAVHRANHPQTAHYVADVFEVDPVMAMDLAYLTGQRPADVRLMRIDDVEGVYLRVGQGKTSKKIRILMEVDGNRPAKSPTELQH